MANPTGELALPTPRLIERANLLIWLMALNLVLTGVIAVLVFTRGGPWATTKKASGSGRGSRLQIRKVWLTATHDEPRSKWYGEVMSDTNDVSGLKTRLRVAAEG